MPSRFTQVQIPTRVGGNRLSGSVITKLAGIDMVTPVDEMKEGRTPYARNFRLYENTLAGREVAVSSRKGPGFYTNPLTETLSASNTGSVGASTANIGGHTNSVLQRFTAAANGQLSKIEISLAAGTATAVVRVDIHTDVAGKPDQLLTSSSFIGISTTTTEYAAARFVNAAKLNAGSSYWIVLHVQDDGIGEAIVATTTGGTYAWRGVESLPITEQTYSILFKTYIAPEAKPLGSYRFNIDGGINKTLVAYGTTMYVVDEATNSFKPLVTGLSANASYYDFTDGDGKVFWVNGYDKITTWNGIHEDQSTNVISNGGFDTNTTGWTLATAVRSTADFKTGPASLNAPSNTWSARQTVTLTKNKRYKLSFWAKSSNTGTLNIGTGTTDPGTDIKVYTGVPNVWTYYETYFAPDADKTSIGFASSNFQGYIDDIKLIDTNIEYVTDPELDILRLITFHKNRLFGVSASDRNRVVFSEEPGNPTDKPANEQWYRQWLSVSFTYVPRPKHSSPITALVSFQDNLIIFTQDKKYMISGSDRGSFFQREAIGNAGALSPNGVTHDANYIYFVSDTGIMVWNGSKDEEISGLIKPLFDACPDKWGINLALWDSSLRVYMNSELSSVKDITAIFSNRYGEWMLDTETYVYSALNYDDADDDMELIEFGSQIAIAYNAEQTYHSLGAPIDFDYRLRYDSRGIPGQKKKFKRYVPLVQSVGRSFPITYGIDKDFEDVPKEKSQDLTVGGIKVGEFNVGDGTLLTGSTSFKPKKVSISGYSHYMQFRVKRNAVDNQVAFMGVQFTFKAKKL